MMPRYIDADKLQEQILERPTPMYRDELLPLINALQKADGVEVKHGRWITNFSSDRLLCSNCNCGRKHQASLHGTYEHLPPFPRYCENCGARMDNVDAESDVIEASHADAEYYASLND